MGRVHPNKSLIETYLGAFAGGDINAITACVSETFKNEHLSFLGRGCEGRSVYRERLSGFLAAFEGLSYTIEHAIADDAQGAARYTMTFTQNGKAFSIGGIFWFLFEGGLIAARTDCWDSLEYFKQAGTSAEEIASLLA